MLTDCISFCLCHVGILCWPLFILWDWILYVPTVTVVWPAGKSSQAFEAGCEHPVVGLAVRSWRTPMGACGTEAMLRERGKWHDFRMSFVITPVFVTLV